MDGESRSDCVFASPRRVLVLFDTVSHSKSCFCGWNGTNWGFGWYLSRICLADWVRNPWQPRRADHTASSQPAPRQSFAYRRLGTAPAFGWKNPRGPAANRPAAVFRERSGNPQRAALPNPKSWPLLAVTHVLSAHNTTAQTLLELLTLHCAGIQTLFLSSRKGSDAVLAQMPGVLHQHSLALPSVIEHYGLIWDLAGSSAVCVPITCVRKKRQEHPFENL